MFGCVDPEYTSSEIRGLFIVVRMLKSVKGNDWPRLMIDTDRHHWLTYDFDFISTDDLLIKGIFFLYLLNYIHNYRIFNLLLEVDTKVPLPFVEFESEDECFDEQHVNKDDADPLGSDFIC